MGTRPTIGPNTRALHHIASNFVMGLRSLITLQCHDSRCALGGPTNSEISIIIHTPNNVTIRQCK